MAAQLMKFGTIVLTSGVNDKVAEESGFAKFVFQSMKRHFSGDWGDLDKEDWAENEYSVNRPLRLLSAYNSKTQPKIWIITEADRSATTVLFPSEY